MCSIFGIIGAPPEGNFRKIAVRQSNLLVHRGPDSCGISKIGDCYIAHNRISSVDVFTGGQPIWHPDGKSAVVANAEIYNHAALREEFPHYPFQTRSDCEVILPLVNSGAAENLNKLRGMFAFIAVQDGGKRYCIARDHMGILSLYYGYDARGVLYVASEMKALVESGGQPLSCEHAAKPDKEVRPCVPTARLKSATGPIWSRTSFTHSFTTSSCGRLLPLFRQRKPSGDWPLRSSATPSSQRPSMMRPASDPKGPE